MLDKKQSINKQTHCKELEIHLKTGNEHTNKFTKKVYYRPDTLIVCSEGDETLCIPIPHGNKNNQNKAFIPAKPSNITQIENIISNSKDKPQIVYKNNQESTKV